MPSETVNEELLLRLCASWQDTFRSLHVAPEAAKPLFTDLRTRYSASGRFYHDLGHVAFLLDLVADWMPQMTVTDPDSVCLAVWFHDAIYDTRSPDNEENSAAFAVSALRGLNVGEDALAVVERLILATKTHEAGAEDTDCHVLLDADLAVLGTSPVAYDAYAQAIRREYAWASEDDWRAGRSQVLRRFLQRPRIYLTPLAFRLLEVPARQNLQRELNTLA